MKKYTPGQTFKTEKGRGRSTENKPSFKRQNSNRLSNPKESLGRNFGRRSVEEVLKNATEKVQKVNSNVSLEDLKNQLNTWAETEKIPGKFQAWFVADAKSENSDWRIIKKLKGEHESLEIEAPSKAFFAPEIVSKTFEQLKKEHLHIFCKALRQIWFRAVGDGTFAVLVQANLKGKFSAHGYKTFVDFIKKHPQVISLHHIQCVPDYPFEPSGKIPMKVEAKVSIGKDFMPIGSTGFSMHVLDWAPRCRDTWLGLPKRIADAIHPTPEDSFFEFYSGCGFVGASLANLFKKVVAMDCRECAMLSAKLNARTTLNDNMRFIRSHVEESFFQKFFSKEENEGRWTFYFNLPESETLPQGVLQIAASSRPERILIQTSDLEIAKRTIKNFRNVGYMLRKTIPLYLVPGSGKFEVLFLFVPDRAGVLGLNPVQSQKTRNVQRPREVISKKRTRETPTFEEPMITFKQRKG